MSETTRCRCGHPAFPAGGDRGHFRSSGDTSRERTGPCRDCMCTGYEPAPDAEGYVVGPFHTAAAGHLAA